MYSTVQVGNNIPLHSLLILAIHSLVSARLESQNASLFLFFFSISETTLVLPLPPSSLKAELRFRDNQTKIVIRLEKTIG